MDLKDQVSFSLAVPEPVELPQAELAQASVQRHVLEIQMTQVHELEALRLIQQLQARHALVTRMAACLFAQPNPDGLTAQCRVNFLHIDPTPTADNNAAE